MAIGLYIVYYFLCITFYRFPIIHAIKCGLIENTLRYVRSTWYYCCLRNGSRNSANLWYYNGVAWYGNILYDMEYIKASKGNINFIMFSTSLLHNLNRFGESPIIILFMLFVYGTCIVISQSGDRLIMIPCHYWYRNICSICIIWESRKISFLYNEDW